MRDTCDDQPMTGHIIHRPDSASDHHCYPPPETELWPGAPTVDPLHGRTTSGEPDGTVWRCDCDRTWITDQGSWRPERRRERRRRERAERRRHRPDGEGRTDLGGTVVHPPVTAPEDRLPPSAAVRHPDR